MKTILSLDIVFADKTRSRYIYNKGAIRMQEKVESFLSKCEHEKKLANEKYRWLVQEYAGLLNEEEGYVEVSKEDWEKYKNTESLPTQYVHGKYYVTKKLPIRMTEEEFAAVEKAIPEKVLKGLKQETTGTNKDKDWSYIILLTIACLIWTAGLIISISASVITSGYFNTSSSFSFINFLAGLIPYLLYGAICFFLAEVCKKARKVINVYEKKNKEPAEQ